MAHTGDGFRLPVFWLGMVAGTLLVTGPRQSSAAPMQRRD
jgi:hypothetical protein